MTDLGNNVFPHAISNNGVIAGQGAAATPSSLAAGSAETSRT
jgi:hypothetical protein